MDIKTIIKREESGSIERKPSLSQIDEIIETISAFSNTKGGMVLIGVTNDGKVRGVEVGKDSIERLSNNIIQSTDPKVHPEISVEDVEKKKIIRIEVKESTDKLVLAFGRPYKRVGKSTVKMSKEEYERLILEKHKDKIQFDNQICEDATYKDVDDKKVRWYLEQREKERNISKKIRISIKRFLQNIKAVEGNKPANAGILFFGKYPQRFLPNARLRVVKFKGTKVIHPTLDTANCEGTIWEMINIADDFIRKNIRLLGTRTEKSFRRENKFEYPMKALREAITNALIHRNYFETGDVRAFIFDDRIEVINPGTFPKGVSPNNPRHKPVNEILCQLVYDIGYIEKYGSGIQLMKELSKSWGNKEPYYELHPIETKVIFESQIKESTFIEIEENILAGLNERQKEAVECIRLHGKITTKEYVELAKISLRTAKRDLLVLKEKHIIKFIGPPKTGYYCLK